MYDKCEVLPVENPVQLLQGCVEGDLLEGGEGGLGNGVCRLHLAFEELALKAAQCGHSLNGSEIGVGSHNNMF